MSKTIFFGRHAKSSWDDFSLKDHDRPLNKRGFKDANMIGDYIYSLKNIPKVIISSSALRAKSTAEIYNKYINCQIFNIEKKLYLAPPQVFIQLAGKISDKYDSAIMIAHNPGITELANIYSEKFISNVPTAGIIEIRFDVNNWKEISTYNGNLINFIYPKLIKQ